MITIKDISRLSGFSVTTVSKVLNNYNDISQSTKDKILKICEEVGYIPNQSARSLVTQKSYTIGIIYEESTGVGLQHPLFSKILESFKNVVESKGYDILFLSNSMGTMQGSYLQHSLRKRVEGILVLCGDFARADFLEVYASDIPTIVIDFEYENVHTVTSNNKLGVYQAVRYLRDLGHKKVGQIHGALSLGIGEQRYYYFFEAMKKYGLEIHDQYSVEGDFFMKEDGYRAMKQILELEDPPTGIFCASDMLALGAIQAIREADKRVPEDFSIIGFDGIEIGQLLNPPLTTIKQDTTKMGKIAANQVLNMINDVEKKEQQTVFVDTLLISGETTKVIRDE
jgi:DNA-binding LacI/PurR family transcriptional regulator